MNDPKQLLIAFLEWSAVMAQLVFVFLKVAGYIFWSWPIVLLPLFIGVALFFTGFFMGFWSKRR